MDSEARGMRYLEHHRHHGLIVHTIFIVHIELSNDLISLQGNQAKVE